MGPCRVILWSVCLALATPAALAGEPPSIPPVPLRIVTLNVKEGLGLPGQTAYEAVGDFVTTDDDDGPGPNRGLNPDIVCFQELDYSDAGELVTFVNAFLPGYQIFPPAPPTQGGDTFNYNALVIRPDIQILYADSPGFTGPRRVARAYLGVPGALKPLAVYGAHFKSGTDVPSQNTRRAEADTGGIRVYDDLTLGFDLDGDGVRETPPGNLIFLGDLNSNDNFDGTLDGLFVHPVHGAPTGILNLPVESISGAGDPSPPHLTYTFFNGTSLLRLDYICLDEQLAGAFDADGSGGFSQDEYNSMGFVYWSQHDQGQQANGNAQATTQASDHRPVVFDVLLERDPATWTDPLDVDQDGSVDAEDLQRWENLYFTLGGAPDVTGDDVVDLADREAIREAIRAGEISSMGM